MLTRENIHGYDVSLRQETFDPRMGYTWDASVFLEVVEGDCYGLREIAASGAKPRNIVDIGANIGSFTMFAKYMWPEARVIAVEPFPGTFEVLEVNTQNLPGVERVRKAIMGTSGAPVKLIPPTCAIGGGNNNGGDARVDPAGTIEVQTCTLTEISATMDEVDILKLDCEGMEMEILKEAMSAGTLGKIRRIRGETHGLQLAEDVRKLLEPMYSFSIKFGGVLGAFKADLRSAP